MKKSLKDQYFETAIKCRIPPKYCGVDEESIKYAFLLERSIHNADQNFLRLFEIAHELETTKRRSFDDSPSKLDAALKGKN